MAVAEKYRELKCPSTISFRIGTLGMVMKTERRNVFRQNPVSRTKRKCATGSCNEFSYHHLHLACAWPPKPPGSMQNMERHGFLYKPGFGWQGSNIMTPLIRRKPTLLSISHERLYHERPRRVVDRFFPNHDVITR